MFENQRGRNDWTVLEQRKNRDSLGKMTRTFSPTLTFVNKLCYDDVRVSQSDCRQRVPSNPIP